ncbi:MAG: transcription antitermination factor NusB [Eubacteriales bacterium]|nr:transcription antitermination factor NusB [Eubacteriales bacterium]
MPDEILSNNKENETPEINEAYENRNNISRYKVREQTVLLTFERLFTDGDIDEIADNVIDSRDVYYSDEAIKTAKLIDELKDEIDSRISAHLSKGWRISRISKTSLAIMRVAVFEMCYLEEIPVSVAINEAVELAKKYTPDESKFVNGVLGAVAGEDA